jgi:regulator of sigma E protease
VPKTITLNPNSFAKEKDYGVYPIDMMISQVEPNSPAELQGLKVGDYLLGAEGIAVLDRFSFSELIQNNAAKPMSVRIIRKGQIIPKKLLAETKTAEKMLGMESTIPFLGVELYNSYSEPEVSSDSVVRGNLMGSLSAAVSRSVEIGKMTAVGFAKLFQGQLSLKTLGGPIMIFQIAGKSLELGGLLAFFQMIAVLSISLGMINLLPIPVLDGGHFLFFVIEGVKGGPLNKKIIEVAQQVGLSILILLMLFTFYNDIMRFF